MQSFRASECNNGIRAHNELYRFRSDIPRSLRRPQRNSRMEFKGYKEDMKNTQNNKIKGILW